VKTAITGAVRFARIWFTEIDPSDGADIAGRLTALLKRSAIGLRGTACGGSTTGLGATFAFCLRAGALAKGSASPVTFLHCFVLTRWRSAGRVLPYASPGTTKGFPVWPDRQGNRGASCCASEGLSGLSARISGRPGSNKLGPRSRSGLFTG
jgi:hypothetical protein